MMEDDIPKDDELEGDAPLDELEGKKKGPLEDDVESIEDVVEEELDLDKEDIMDDVEEM